MNEDCSAVENPEKAGITKNPTDKNKWPFVIFFEK
jgi:hypothetical protein